MLRIGYIEYFTGSTSPLATSGRPPVVAVYWGSYEIPQRRPLSKAAPTGIPVENRAAPYAIFLYPAKYRIPVSSIRPEPEPDSHS